MNYQDENTTTMCKESQQKTPKTLKEKIIRLKENITLEPVLIFYVIPGVLAKLATQNLNLDKVCRVNMNYSSEICDALIARKGDYIKEEQNVQEMVSGMEAWRNVILTAIPSFLILFVGAWSDSTGKRKICILLPIVGDFLTTLCNILSVFFFYEMPVQVSMFLEAFFPAITGGWITTYMGAFSYIGDISSEESRTLRVGIANLCLTAGSPIGSALSGILLEKIGYYGVFILSSVLNLISIIYGYYFIMDPDLPFQEKEKKDKESLCSFLKSFFDLKHVKDTLSVAFKDGKNKRRIKSILILASIVFVYGPSYGEATVRYLFTRYRFNWDALKYSAYSTYNICIHGLGALISISLFSHRLLWDDSSLGILSSISKLIGGIATKFARNSFEMYLAVTIEVFNATSFTAMRAISSKLCASNEIGKMTSVFNLVEVMTSMTFGPIYSWIYMVTLEKDAGAIYYISTVLTVPTILIFVWFNLYYRRTKKNLKITESASEEEKQDLNRLN